MYITEFESVWRIENNEKMMCYMNSKSDPYSAIVYFPTQRIIMTTYHMYSYLLQIAFFLSLEIMVVHFTF